MNARLLERYRGRLAGVLTGDDRTLITGTRRVTFHAGGMTRVLNAQPVRILDCPDFLAGPQRDRLRMNAEPWAAESALTTACIATSPVGQETILAEVIEARGDHPGQVPVRPSREACASCPAWHDKRTRQTFLPPASGTCQHDAFRVNDADPGQIPDPFARCDRVCVPRPVLGQRSWPAGPATDGCRHRFWRGASLLPGRWATYPALVSPSPLLFWSF